MPEVLARSRLAQVCVGCLAYALAACAASAPPLGPADWDGTDRGTGPVPTRLESEYDEPITIRFEDLSHRIEAQVTLPARGIEVVYLTQGTAHISVAMQSGGVIVQEGHVQIVAPVLASDSPAQQLRFFPKAEH
jgi:hypothetical protein